MAFRQTLFRLAPGIKRADVHPALVKAWSKHYKVCVCVYKKLLK